MDVEAVLAEIRQSPFYRGQILHIRERPARPACYAERALPLSPEVQAYLAAQGITRFYSHQAEAIEAVLRGEDICTVSGTASGKTLTYLVPILEALQKNPGQRALLIYPTKALAQDQLRKLRDYGAGQRFLAETYDGDTPRERRREIRRQAQVVLTNPDMLHIGLLPYHHTWADFFRHLQFVVLDEIHIYRGVFGAHTANVLRRLRRLCAHYGARPRFIGCSATIGNPEALTKQLTGLSLRVIREDGAPRSRQWLIFWNPPVLEKKTGRRRSGNVEAAELMAFFVRRGIRHLTFTLARSQAELILRYVRQQLAKEGLADRVMAYRGGYLPAERRAIERRLFSGELLGVTATTALELGVDIGGLDAVILVGYPGTIASTWQQMGRAGRGAEDSLAVLIGLSGPLHQYVVHNPDYLLSANSEHVSLDPENPYILAGQLMCAAYEAPLGNEDIALFGEKTPALLEILREAGYVAPRGRYYWVDPALYPAAEISLRSATGTGYDIVDLESETLLGTIDAASALRMVYPGAVYLHAGLTYIVEQLDCEKKIAYVRPGEVNYYTQPQIHSEIRKFSEPAEAQSYGPLQAVLSSVLVRAQVVGFQKIRQITEQPLGAEPLDLPAEDFETMGLWLLPQGTAFSLPEGEAWDPAGALHALEHVLIMLLPLVAACDPHDVGGISTPWHPDVGGPAICLYDGYPGGMGMVEAAFDRILPLLQAAQRTLAQCPCEEGCPACVQQATCGSMNRPLDKHGALRLLQRWLDEIAGAPA